MALLQVIQQKCFTHKYAINPVLLGDCSTLAWSNLGLWQTGQQNYMLACCALADHLAASIQLHAQDRVLDLGSGYGASVLYWQTKYHVSDIESVELQAACTAQMQQYFQQNVPVHCASYLNLAALKFKQKFDVVLCIDSAYHSALPLFLAAVCPVLNPQARIGFHYLALSDRWVQATALEKYQYKLLLKSADIQLQQLQSKTQIEQQLQQFEFKNIVVTDLSREVLSGFADYIEHYVTLNKKCLDYFKIKMTAKLCHKLFADGLIEYILVSGVYK